MENMFFLTNKAKPVRKNHLLDLMHFAASKRFSPAFCKMFERISAPPISSAGAGRMR
jgi:hypothetical protein